MKSGLWCLVAGVVAVGAAVFFYNKYRVAPVVKFESLALTNLNGQAFSLDSFQNKKVFINFMATWCGPCIGELPALENAQAILAVEGFQFVLVSDEPVERLRILQQHVQLPVLHSVDKLNTLKIYSIPTSYLLNKEGKLVFDKTGEADWADEVMLQELRKWAN